MVVVKPGSSMMGVPLVGIFASVLPLDSYEASQPQSYSHRMYETSLWIPDEMISIPVNLSMEFRPMQHWIASDINMLVRGPRKESMIVTIDQVGWLVS